MGVDDKSSRKNPIGEKVSSGVELFLIGERVGLIFELL